MQNNQWKFIGDRLPMRSGFELKDKSDHPQVAQNGVLLVLGGV